jgi:hypothetical protein
VVEAARHEVGVIDGSAIYLTPIRNRAYIKTGLGTSN